MSRFIGPSPQDFGAHTNVTVGHVGARGGENWRVDHPCNMVTRNGGYGRVSCLLSETNSRKGLRGC